MWRIFFENTNIKLLKINFRDNLRRTIEICETITLHNTFVSMLIQIKFAFFPESLYLESNFHMLLCIAGCDLSEYSEQ